MKIEAKRRRQRERLAEHYIRIGTYIPIPIFYVTKYLEVIIQQPAPTTQTRLPCEFTPQYYFKFALTEFLKLYGDLVQDESVANLPVRNEACFLQLRFLIPTSVSFMDPHMVISNSACHLKALGQISPISASVA
jgi:hypothetical protein